MNKSFKIAIFLTLLFLFVLGSVIYFNEITGKVTEEKMTRVLLETNYGNVTINLYSDMPITSGNFEKLVRSGFYDGVIFHRVIEGFMIQGGDPKGTGTGGPGYTIKDEFTHAGGNKNIRGTISMANSGRNTGGSQFFINLVDNSYLDSKHPAFGKVIEGMDVIDKIAQVKTDRDDRPLEKVKIIKATILE
jgi:peptidylprolyl isomerase